VFVDAEEESWNMDPSLVIEEIRRRECNGLRLPRAIEVVHVLGHPANILPLVDVCRENGIHLIEDAAEALGARYSSGPLAGRHVGTVGRVGCYSFNGNKIITSGGGGMLVTDDETLARHAKHLTTQARLPGLDYDHDEVGFNYRMTNVAAAIGLAQLEQLPDFLTRKMRIADTYDAGLKDLPGLTLPPRCGWARPSMWLYSILVDASRFGMQSRALIRALGKEGIECRPVWQPLSRMQPFRSAPRLGGRVGERLFLDGLSIPCSVSLTEEAQAAVIAAIRRAAGRL
jgi:dTDP-4-amino-4,6-dideoxygalactose transaminase